MTSAIDKILRNRGHEPKQADNDEYSGFKDSGGHPQMGFTLVRANGTVDGFFYHSLDNFDLHLVDGSEYLNFTHRGKAVTLKGVNLAAIMHAIMNHSLIEISEASDPDATFGAQATVVTRVLVTTVNLAQETMLQEAQSAQEKMRQH